MIYLDNAATTKMFEGAAQVMADFACQRFYNPSAGYREGIAIAKELQAARNSLMQKLGASEGDIIFTSGATESNNLAIRGSIRNGKWEYVFSAGEHPSVYNVALYLRDMGFAVKFVPLQANGEIDYMALENAITDRTRLVSVMHVSNETGAINDIQKVASIRHRKCPNALLHVDGVQAFCKFPFRLDQLDVDLYSISAHKFHGPKGVGALYVRNLSGLKNIVYGGGQEKGYRSGTENIAGIKAMQWAFEHIDPAQNYEKAKRLAKVLLEDFQQNTSTRKDCLIGNNQSDTSNHLNNYQSHNEAKTKGIHVFQTENPYVFSVRFDGVNGETLMRSLEDEVIIGIGSACSAKYAGNRILNELKFSKEEIKASVRISLNAYILEDELHDAVSIILEKYHELRRKVQ